LGHPSTYYRPRSPPTGSGNFNGSRFRKDAPQKSGTENGKITTKTARNRARLGPRREPPKTALPPAFYEVIGSRPFANDYSIRIRQGTSLLYEKTRHRPGHRPAKSSASSANDILGHQVGPDSPQMRSMALELDKSLAEFFDFPRSSDRTRQCLDGALRRSRRRSPTRLRQDSAPARRQSRRGKLCANRSNSLLSKKYAKKADYVIDLDYPARHGAGQRRVHRNCRRKDESIAEADHRRSYEASRPDWLLHQIANSLVETFPPPKPARRYAKQVLGPKADTTSSASPRPFQVGIHARHRSTPRHSPTIPRTASLLRPRLPARKPNRTHGRTRRSRP